MKKIGIIACLITLMIVLIACGKTTSENDKIDINYKNTVTRENDSGEKVMEILNFVKNDKHFDFIRNVKVREDEDYKTVLNMDDSEYFDMFDKAGNITYPLGKIYLFHVRDVNQIGNVMMKAINIKGSTIDDSSRKYDARYLVATCGNYLIIGIGEAENNDEVRDIISAFEGYFGKDNLDSIYNLLLEKKKTS